MEYGYWNIQGLGEPIRWLIAYLALDVTEVNPPSGEAWAELKAELRTKQPFINLPYMKIGNQVYSESYAVANAIVTRAGRIEMLGKGDQDSISVAMLRSVNIDIRKFTFGLFERELEDLQANLAGEYEAKIVPKLEGFVTQLGNRPFLMYYVTIADFELAYYSSLFDFIECNTGVQNPINAFPSLVKMINHLRSLPGLSQYLNSSKGPNSRSPLFPHLMKFIPQAE